MTSAPDRDALWEAAQAAGRKVDQRLPGFRRIIEEMRDSDDPDRVADAAYLLGTFSDITESAKAKQAELLAHVDALTDPLKEIAVEVTLADELSEAEQITALRQVVRHHSTIARAVLAEGEESALT